VESETKLREKLRETVDGNVKHRQLFLQGL